MEKPSLDVEVMVEPMEKMESKKSVSPAKMAAAEEIISAMESKSPERLAEAFSNMIEICNDEYEYGEE